MNADDTTLVILRATYSHQTVLVVSDTAQDSRLALAECERRSLELRAPLEAARYAAGLGSIRFERGGELLFRSRRQGIRGYRAAVVIVDHPSPTAALLADARAVVASSPAGSVIHAA